MSKWTKKKSRRRNELIDKKYESDLTKGEEEELANLQAEFGDYQDENFPLPSPPDIQRCPNCDEDSMIRKGEKYTCVECGFSERV